MRRRVALLAVVVLLLVALSTAQKVPIDITPSDAFQFLQNSTQHILIDVRTDPEWNFVGIPDSSKFAKSENIIFENYLVWPDWSKNAKFIPNVMTKLSNNSNFDTKVSKLFFMCCCGLLFSFCCLNFFLQKLFRRIGGRSKRSSTEMLNNYPNLQVYNVLYGFQGDLDTKTKHREAVNGWKFSQLPWAQN